MGTPPRARGTGDRHASSCSAWAVVWSGPDIGLVWPTLYNLSVVVGQQQQVSNHYQQADQMMNQTKDQMLLQAPNKMHMSQGNVQNPNQQINPTDKLSQVVDDL